MKAYAPHSENKTRTLETSSAPSRQASIEEILQTYHTPTFEMPPVHRQKTEIQKEKNSPSRFDFFSPFPAGWPVLQRQAITLRKGLIEGSEEENDDAFWNDLQEKYQEEGIYQGLKELIQYLRSRWYRGELANKDWERGILSTAVENFATDSGYTYFEPISSPTSEKIKDLFKPKESPAQEEPSITPLALHLSLIATALSVYATGELSRSAQIDNPAIKDIDEYTILLKRAVEIISQQYGLKIMYASLFNGADDSVLENLSQVTIHHSSERWENASNEDKMREGLAAIQWSMSNIPAIRKEVDKACIAHSASLHTIIASYSTYYFRNLPTYRTMYDNLAKVRLLWGPITYGKDIYLNIPRMKLNLEEKWLLLKMLIHETLHAIEHPNFTSFLVNNVPMGLQSDLREGITEYLTQSIWEKLIDELPTGRDTLSDLTNPLTVASSRKKKLRDIDKQYPFQVEIINAILSLLDQQEGSGARRLEEAYFSGNIQAFLPTFSESEMKGMDE